MCTGRASSSTVSPVARQVVGALAVDLDGRERRRRLQDLAGEARQQRLDGLARRAHVAGGDDLALGVVGVGGRAPAHGEAVVLGAVDGVGHGLGRLAQRDRQDAGRQRVERAGVAGLARIEEPAHGADRLRRRHADRLVQHQPAVDRPCPSCGVPCSILSEVLPDLVAGQQRARCGRPRRTSRRPGSERRARTSD